jgi:hypothetical protein
MFSIGHHNYLHIVSCTKLYENSVIPKVESLEVEILKNRYCDFNIINFKAFNN